MKQAHTLSVADKVLAIVVAIIPFFVGALGVLGQKLLLTVFLMCASVEAYALRNLFSVSVSKKKEYLMRNPLRAQKIRDSTLIVFTSCFIGLYFVGAFVFGSSELFVQEFLLVIVAFIAMLGIVFFVYLYHVRPYKLLSDGVRLGVRGLLKYHHIIDVLVSDKNDHSLVLSTSPKARRFRNKVVLSGLVNRERAIKKITNYIPYKTSAETTREK